MLSASHGLPAAGCAAGVVANAAVEFASNEMATTADATNWREQRMTRAPLIWRATLPPLGHKFDVCSSRMTNTWALTGLTIGPVQLKRDSEKVVLVRIFDAYRDDVARV